MLNTVKIRSLILLLKSSRMRQEDPWHNFGRPNRCLMRIKSRKVWPRLNKTWILTWNSTSTSMTSLQQEWKPQWKVHKLMLVKMMTKLISKRTCLCKMTKVMFKSIYLSNRKKLILTILSLKSIIVIHARITGLSTATLPNPRSKNSTKTCTLRSQNRVALIWPLMCSWLPFLPTLFSKVWLLVSRPTDKLWLILSSLLESIRVQLEAVLESH